MIQIFIHFCAYVEMGRFIYVQKLMTFFLYLLKPLNTIENGTKGAENISGGLF